MYNKFMDEKEINVKAGDRVVSHGNRGTVTKVYRGTRREWSKEEQKYVDVPNSEWTTVQIHFDEDSELVRGGYMQYQDGEYGEYWVIADDQQ